MIPLDLNPAPATMIAPRHCIEQKRDAKRQHDQTMQTSAPELSKASPTVKFTEKNLRNFWRKVDKNGPIPDQTNPHYQGIGACWPWTAAIAGRLYRSGRGYGCIRIKDTLHMTHRISWMIHNGSIPDGFCVLHRCDNSKCCNPVHLFLGTVGENNTDRESKGRGDQPRGEASGMRLHPECVARGEDQGNSKLTSAEVTMIRAAYARGGNSQADLAAEFNVHQTLIGRIVRRVIWAYVP